MFTGLRSRKRRAGEVDRKGPTRTQNPNGKAPLRALPGSGFAATYRRPISILRSFRLGLL